VPATATAPAASPRGAALPSPTSPQSSRAVVPADGHDIAGGEEAYFPGASGAAGSNSAAASPSRADRCRSLACADRTPATVVTRSLLAALKTLEALCRPDTRRRKMYCRR
jgi:hypothetical protein